MYNGGDAFRACLASLRALVPPPHELIVVADGDTDGSREHARAAGAQVIERASPGGPARARNLGARAASGDVLFFADADVTLPPDAIAQIGAVFASQPDLTALIGSYDDAPAAPNFLSQYKNLLHHYVHQTGNEQASTFWGACGAIRRDVFLELGGFDERYDQPSIEDIELGYRLIARGDRIRLHKALQVKHLKRWTAWSLVRTDFVGRALPWTALILRDRRMANDLNVGWRSRASIICTYSMIGALLAAYARPRALLVAGACAGTLVWLNAAVYRFFVQQRGLVFALRALPWHWLYYGYSGLAFGIGLAQHLAAAALGSWRPPPKQERTDQTGGGSTA